MSLLQARSLHRTGNLSKADYIDRMFDYHGLLFEYAQLLSGTDITKIEIEQGHVCLVVAPGIKIICDRPDKRIVPFEVLNFDHYEQDDTDLMLRLIRPGQTVFDVGANIGWYSLLISRNQPDATVYAFEPIPRTFAFLERNVRANNVSNIRVFPFGLSDKSGAIAFVLDDRNSVAAHVACGVTGTEGVTAHVRRLDDFVADNHATLHFLKCDVEGAELLVLRGGMETIRRDCPILFLEMLRKWAARFGYHPNDIIELLRPLGYDCYFASAGKLVHLPAMDDTTASTNFFFLHRERHAEEIASLAQH